MYLITFFKLFLKCDLKIRKFITGLHLNTATSLVRAGQLTGYEWQAPTEYHYTNGVHS